MTKTIRILMISILLFAIAFPVAATEAPPALTVEVLASGLTNPWDVGFLPDGNLVFTQRPGTVSLISGGNVTEIARILDVAARGEGGLMGIAVDTAFDEHPYLYVAYNTLRSGSPEVVVTRYTYADNALTAPMDIITGLPAIPGGRHSGAQLEMDASGVLWVGTGDAATGANPQDPTSLGGKVLRVQRDGTPAEGNLGEPFDPRIFSYGHRNTQGLALLSEPVDGVYGYSAEHGSYRDDELNPLVPGNFGWSPHPPYDESVLMTDLDRFPDAIPAAWSSGERTIAISGVTQLRGDHWGILDGAWAMAVLKDQHVRVVRIENGATTAEWKLLESEYGRIRASVLGPDGALYLTTDNGSDDKVLRITPTP